MNTTRNRRQVRHLAVVPPLTAEARASIDRVRFCRPMRIVTATFGVVDIIELAARNNVIGLADIAGHLVEARADFGGDIA